MNVTYGELTPASVAAAVAAAAQPSCQDSLSLVAASSAAGTAIATTLEPINAHVGNHLTPNSIHDHSQREVVLHER